MPRLPLNSFPRLTVDSQGAVYLSFRTREMGRSQLGSVWHSHLAYYDGASWKGPGVIPNTDYWIDMRPAMAAVAPGELMLIGVRDHRQQATSRGGGPAAVRES